MMDDRPVGGTWMSCCLLWEEDENTVDYSAHDGEGYRHWRGDCRRSWSPAERQAAYYAWREQQRQRRPRATATVEVQTALLRLADGRIWGARVYAPKVCDSLFFLNREADDLEELRPYRPGMFREVRR